MRYIITYSSKLLFALLMLAGLAAAAQGPRVSITLRGTVTNDIGETLQGVTVTLAEARIGAITDERGFYTLSGVVAEGSYTLRFATMGYAASEQRITLSAASATQGIDARLSEDILSLDEVVVTGNGPTATRKQLGNAIGVVEGSNIQRAGTPNVLAALSGKVAGAQITQNDGNPAGGISVRLRGPSSIKGSSDPLYIVDGVIVDNSSTNVINLSADAMTTGLQAGQNRLVDINPNDIERIEVLNGAAAAAIYGSRASNGVVQIFTRRGKAGKPVIEFSTTTSVSRLRKEVFMTEHGERFGVKGNDRLESAQDRLTILLTIGLSEQQLKDRGVNYSKVGSTNRILVTDKYAVQRYNYQDEIFETAYGTDNYLSMSGGGERSNYFASFGYTDNNGIIKNTNFTKYTGRLRLNQTLSDWASLSLGMSYTYSKSKDMPNGNNFFSPISTMFIMDNVWDITERDANGNLKAVEQVRVNPLSVVETFEISQRTNRSTGDVQLNLFPVKGLSINAILGYDTYSLVGDEYHPRLPYPGVAANFFPDGYVSYAASNVLLINHDLTANYSRQLGSKLSSTTTAGYQIQYSRSHFTAQEGRDLAPFVRTINAAANLFSPPMQSIAERSVWGYFLQETFGYDNQIFLTLAGRVDGSSAFAPANQTNFYPKASLSWVLSDYWKGGSLAKLLGTAKLRGSYGQAGNLTGIGPYDRYNNYLLSNLNGFASIVPSRTLANPDVKPERMTETELGLDLALFNNRLGINFSLYQQTISDLLLDRLLPPSAGGTSIVTNVGGMTNRGIEVLANLSAVRRKNFDWNIGLNWSRNRNEVTGIDGVLFLRGSDGTQAAIAGQPFGVFYGRYYARNEAGELLTTAQGLAQPERGTQSALLEGSASRDPNGQPTGTELRKVIGDPNPDWVGSLISDLRWKGLGFHFQFDAFWGADIYNWNRVTQNNVGQGELAERELKGEVPRGYVASVAGGVTGQRIQEEHVEDASYIKLREISFSYNFGQVGRAFQDLTLSLAGRNLVSFDSYTGFDPETNSAGQNDRVRGDDFGNVPIPMSMMLRLGAKF